MREYLLCILVTSSINLVNLHYGAKNISITHEIAITLIGITNTIFGDNLNPSVSSSKNRNNPALDAGKGAVFLLILDVEN